MTVALQLANQVRRLGRENLTVEQIALRLCLPEQAITDALSMLDLPLPGVAIEWRAASIDKDRAALRAKIPKKWQDRPRQRHECATTSAAALAMVRRPVLRYDRS